MTTVYLLKYNWCVEKFDSLSKFFTLRNFYIDTKNITF